MMMSTESERVHVQDSERICVSSQPSRRNSDWPDDVRHQISVIWVCAEVQIQHASKCDHRKATPCYVRTPQQRPLNESIGMTAQPAA